PGGASAGLIRSPKLEHACHLEHDWSYRHPLCRLHRASPRLRGLALDACLAGMAPQSPADFPRAADYRGSRLDLLEGLEAKIANTIGDTRAVAALLCEALAQTAGWLLASRPR